MSTVTAQPVSRQPHDPLTGRFAPATANWTVAEVTLPNGRVGYRIGDKGQIFASRDHAIRHAMTRRPRVVKTQVPTRVKFDSTRLLSRKALRARLASFGAGIGEETAKTPEAAPTATQDAGAAVVGQTAALEPAPLDYHARWSAGQKAHGEYLRAYAAALAADPVARSNADAGTYDARTGGYWTGD